MSDAIPKAIGPYSPARQAGETVYLSGQIPLDPATMQLVGGGFSNEAHQVFKNLMAVIHSSRGTSANVTKLTIYLTDLTNMPALNDIMMQYFETPYPARTTIQIAALPKQAQIEVDAILVLT